MEQQAPAAAGSQVERLRPDETQALERVLERLSERLAGTSDGKVMTQAEVLGKAARRMVLAAFRPS